MDKIDITKIVNSSILQRLPDSFYNATGFATGIHDLSGRNLTTISPKCYCEFCKEMYYSKEGHARCIASNFSGEKKSFETNGVYVYECHAGLTDVAAPVIVNGLHVASVNTGQVLLQELNDETRTYVKSRLSGLPSDFIDKQVKLLEKVRVVSKNQIKGVAGLLASIANTIVDLIISSAKEKEINVTKSRLIDSIQYCAMFETEKRNAEIRLRESEIKLLQLQINPHFLYNTLDSIYWLAVLQRPNEIQNVVLATSSFLRQSLDTSNPINLVSKEIENVKNYLYIQKVKIGRELNYAIDVESEVLNYLLPKLMLLTIVENSLKHGIEPKGGKGYINIHGWRASNGDAVLEVVDDGVGIEKNQLKILQKYISGQKLKISDRISTTSTGIGLYNVQKRLQYYYEGSSGLDIKSTKGKGTTIRFQVPPEINPTKFQSDI